jgi:RHS repeat-associated protein
MTSDGLSDIVRIRNGEICYWPNLGYGRFGAKVSMDNAPWFDTSELFRQTSLHLADIDGSGTTDIVYLGSRGALVYQNRAGNGWTDGKLIGSFPSSTNLSNVQVIDLLGQGTSCLVWSSPLASDSGRQMRFINLLSDGKPYLMTSMVNNLGSETVIKYSTSTNFYLTDKTEGKPWATQLPFPVHVVSEVQTIDRINGNHFTTRYAYHEGYYDGVEREFRGFGMIESWDTEHFAETRTEKNDSSVDGNAANFDASFRSPPVLTKTWYHTGAYFENRSIMAHFRSSFYEEPDLEAGEAEALIIPETETPGFIRRGKIHLRHEMSSEELRESYRALKGCVLRQEIYGIDGTPQEAQPYRITQTNYTIDMLQPRACNRYAMFFTFSKETVEMEYERALFSVSGRMIPDPRISHTLNLVTDEYGNVLQSVSISYGRRINDPNPLLTPEDRAKQNKLLATLTLQKFTNDIQKHDSYRAPLLYEAQVYELVHFPKLCTDGRFAPLVHVGNVHKIVDSVASGRFDLPFEDFMGSGDVENHVYRRQLSRRRNLFRNDSLTKVLPLGELDSKAIHFEDYTEVFTNQLAESHYIGPNKLSNTTQLSEALEVQGGYVRGRDDDGWWSPSGHVFLSPNSDVDERTYAQEHFYLPQRYRDPFYSSTFNSETFVTYDKYDLLIVETLDALGNRLTVGKRSQDPTKPIEGPGYDYRLLAPLLVMDANRNVNAAAYDILGQVTATAVMGKPGTNEGDELSEFTLDLSESELSEYMADPLAKGDKILGNATSRSVYDLWTYYKSKSSRNPLPVVTATLNRETHKSDLASGQKSRIQKSFIYADGFGRNIQTKILAEPEPKKPVTRWVASGWQIFNNKGSVARMYEPFFTRSSQYEANFKTGVSSIMMHDPLQRVVATLDPNHSYNKITWNPWSQQIWDRNDTVLENPVNDPDISGYFRQIPESYYLPTWYQARINGDHGQEEKTAASKAAAHSKTPTKLLFDSLGRFVLTISHNSSQRALDGPRVEEFYVSRRLLDISGNVRNLTDNLNRIVEVSSYDMTGNAISKSSMEAGKTWSLGSVTAGALPIFAWTSRGFQFSTKYDQIQRPLSTSLRQPDGQDFLISKTMYGESKGDPETLNLRTRILKTQDQAAVKTFVDYDFKGNLLSTVTQFPQKYSSTLDWTDLSKVPLDPESYKSFTTYDVLNRPITAKQPDNSLIKTSYNIMSQVQHVDVKMDGSSEWRPVLMDELFNARNQRILTRHGNGTETKYEYDDFTFSLVRMTTMRSANRSVSPSYHNGQRLQDLCYTYDPMENIVHTRDNAQQKSFFKNTVVDPSSSYTYDALYRLIEACGREHLGQQGASSPYKPYDAYRIGLPNPGDGKAMGRYTESYHMDAIGNMLLVKHGGSDAQQPGWTRRYKYEELSQIQPELFNNRLSSTTVGNKTELFHYEGNAGLSGNITSMSHLSSMQWDFWERLRSTAAQRVHTGAPETTSYIYGDDGIRLRKVTDRAATDERSAVKKSERLYLGQYEIYREYSSDGHKVTLERKTLHISNGSHLLAIIDAKIIGKPDGPQQLFRYQYWDNVDSSVLELDEQGSLISYEEYYPYGSTSYQAVRSQLFAPKRYRYTGKERDEESGFDYHGSRYYAPWIARWISPDPIGIADDMDLYAYVKCNPIIKNDPTGNEGQSDPKKQTAPAAPAPVPAPTASGASPAVSPASSPPDAG